MEWLDEFRSVSAQRRPLVMVLATVDSDGGPRARCVVCRRIDADGTLCFASDRRSEKNHELELTPKAEAVCWLESERMQYRFRGSATTTSFVAQREAAWREMSDSARALFLWPPPGQPLDQGSEAFVKTVGASEPMPASFELILLRPQLVERLDLNHHPHRRRRWEEQHAWLGRDLNP